MSYNWGIFLARGRTRTQYSTVCRRPSRPRASHWSDPADVAAQSATIQQPGQLTKCARVSYKRILTVPHTQPPNPGPTRSQTLPPRPPEHPHQSAVARAARQPTTRAPSPLACLRRPPTRRARPFPQVSHPLSHNARTTQLPWLGPHSSRQGVADPCARWTTLCRGPLQRARPHRHAGVVALGDTSLSAHGGRQHAPLGHRRPCHLCATTPAVPHLLCGELLLHENLQT